MLARRALLVALGSGGALLRAAAARAEIALRTKEEVHYQDAPKDVRRCATCALFVAPDVCKVVIGKVSRNGWCDLYEFID